MLSNLLILVGNWVICTHCVDTGRELGCMHIPYSPTCHEQNFIAVVLWSNLLGAFHWREDSLPWSGPSLPFQTSGEWAQTGQAK